jgi:hypothetical protein
MLYDEQVLDNPDEPVRTVLSETITFLHNELRTEGIARNTIADRIRVTQYWTETRVRALTKQVDLRENPTDPPKTLGYHHLRAILGKSDKETGERLNKVLDSIKQTEIIPTVEEIHDIVNGRENMPLYEKRRIQFVKAARKVIADPDSIWRDAATLVVGLSNGD